MQVDSSCCQQLKLAPSASTRTRISNEGTYIRQNTCAHVTTITCNTLRGQIKGSHRATNFSAHRI